MTYRLDLQITNVLAHGGEFNGTRLLKEGGSCRDYVSWLASQWHSTPEHRGLVSSERPTGLVYLLGGLVFFFVRR